MDIMTQILQDYDKSMTKADKEADKEFAVWQKKYLRDVFNDAITQFYASYTPVGASSRSGDMASETGGLYDLFELSNVEDTGAKIFFEDDFSDLYNEANMNSGRKGYNGLFQLVFVEGYHGGAKSISSSKARVWGSHPAPGTPYWRRRGFVRALGRRHKYGKWGRPAKKTTPPKELVESKMNAAFPEMDNYRNKLIKEYEDAKFHNEFADAAQQQLNDYLIGVINRWRKAVR